MTGTRFHFRPCVVVLLIGVCLALVGPARAIGPIKGKWAANAPNGISTYCFGHRDLFEKHCIKGRFSHSWIDCYGGLIVIHGTYILHPDGQAGLLDLHFDNNVHFTEIAYSGNGFLPLWNAGTGTALSYGRLH